MYVGNMLFSEVFVIPITMMLGTGVAFCTVSGDGGDSRHDGLDWIRLL